MSFRSFHKMSYRHPLCSKTLFISMSFRTDENCAIILAIFVYFEAY